jgi:CRP-like cAMP-binding protein
MVDRKAELVRQLGLFSECPRADVQWVCGVADLVDVPAGRVLSLEGETVREVAVVIDGIASAQDGAGDVLLGRGAYFGASELVARRPCAMTIESRTPVRLLVFGAREFRSLMDRIPSVRQRVRSIAQESASELSLRAVS